MTRLFADGGWALNPDVATPPFTWQLALPDDRLWSWLDTNPSSWQRSVERLVDDRLAGNRVAAADRRAVIAHVGDLVTAAQHAGAMLSLVQIGLLKSGELSSAGLQIAWYDSTPDVSDLGTVRRAIAAQGSVEQHDTLAGRLLLQRDVQSMRVPGRPTKAQVTSLQAFLPLRNRCWTAVVATASAHPSMTESLHAIVLAVAGSIEPLDGAGIVEQPGTGPIEPAPKVGPHAVIKPGARRSLRPMTVHRIDPGSPRSEPQS